jgi:pyruvate/2-oxoglutarate/acetoin dehydrogenase E1 component
VGNILTYFDALKEQMMLLNNKAHTIFLGQGCEYYGHAMANSLDEISTNRKYEMPVAEDMQLGITLGLAIDGWLPVSIFPREDFLICGTNQLVNHLDKIPKMAKINPHFIIRVAVGSKTPLNPGVQHCQDHTRALTFMLQNIKVISMRTIDQIKLGYKLAIEEPGQYLMVEYADLYNKEF